MTPEDVIRGFREGVEHTSEEKEYANTLFQEAIKIGMEINQTYHTPEELVKLMSKLTGKAVPSFSAVLYGFWKKYYIRKRCIS